MRIISLVSLILNYELINGMIKLANVAEGKPSCLISNHLTTSSSCTLICLRKSTCKKSWIYLYLWRTYAYQRSGMNFTIGRYDGLKLRPFMKLKYYFLIFIKLYTRMFLIIVCLTLNKSHQLFWASIAVSFALQDVLPF